MKYFTYEEFADSATAEKYGMDNAISLWQKRNVKEFVENLLDPLREAWAEYCKKHDLGKPSIRIASGVRSMALNEAIGGSKTSSHLYGYAADLVPYNGELLKFKLFCMEWLRDKSFDQFISEEEDATGTPKWIHIGYKRYNGMKRHQFMKMVNNKYFNI